MGVRDTTTVFAREEQEEQGNEYGVGDGVVGRGDGLVEVVQVDQ